MHRLNGEDAGFLIMERPDETHAQPMNSMAVGVLEASADPLTVDELRRHIGSRLDELPSWRWRITPVPGNLHHPVAWTPGEPDLTTHVREATVRGGDEALDAFFARLAEEHLDPDLPLWQVWLVNGLDQGRQAVVMKYHHALADGVGAMTTMLRLFSDATCPPPHDAGPARPERRPHTVRLVLAALWAHLLALLTLLPLLLRTRRGTAAVKERRAESEIELPAYSAGAPRTLLNDAFGPGRCYVRAELPLAQVKQVKDAAGVTLNDVVLGMMAGACVRYLARHQPDFDPSTSRSLLTTVPMAFEAPDAPVRQHGNRFWSFTTTLATDVTDPWERLRVISATAREGKAQLDAFGPDLVPDWLDRMPPALARRGVAGVLERLEASTDDADASILVSNIRGPAAPFTLGGREFTRIHIDGPPSNGVGINVMVWSYADVLTFGILGHDRALAHPGDFREALEESFAELARLAMVQPEDAPSSVV
ncbi:wax ester/triacylglycerol synthase family O-acyltransferase [Nocardioides yefusunii]|uniref:Diacylglycerol O-acyltransferase n=1 Tax=Nocardioides yefusunii TaxID=2500546 RepID=A0ABW1R1K2_9ACTN|nr:wax ester/triacylglycerol synthase family O-acyltransferase [Nocardioides yefusunii]